MTLNHLFRKHICTFSFLIFSVLVITLEAQELIKSRQSSELTYIYKLADKEVKKINSKGLHIIDSTYMHTLIDTFPTDSIYNKPLSTGHYIKTCVRGSQQRTEYTYVPSFAVMLLNNDTDFRVQLYDLQGNIITDADVKLKSHKLKYDKKTHCFVKKKSNSKGLLTVTIQGNTAYYLIEKSIRTPALIRGLNTALYSVPLKYIWIPVSFVVRLPIDGVKSIHRGYPQGTIYRTQNLFSEKTYRGYMVFNKPIYRPGDTIKVKTYITNQKGKPLNKPLDLTLNNHQKKITLKEITPYTKGAYEYEFQIDDSLNLKLDKVYNLSLNKKKNHIFSGRFKYEDYELSGIKLKVRTANSDHFSSLPFSIFVSGKDENNLPLMDARLEILGKTNKVSRYVRDKDFIPDTLFYFEKELSPKGETEIEIPVYDLPKADINYDVQVRLLTSDNQESISTENINYYYDQKKFKITLIKDSIEFIFLQNGEAIPASARIYATDCFGNNTEICQTITPCKVELNPFYHSYTIQNDSVRNNIDISTEASLLQCFSQRTNDSIFIKIDNPRNIHFTYNIYKRNTEKERGANDSLQIKERIKTKENYFVSLSYLWGGEIKKEHYRIPFFEKRLNIEVKQPEIIYPGQKARIEISVTDQKNNPVKNVDLTAYSLTSKFNYQMPDLPYYGKTYKNKKIINNFNQRKTINAPVNSTLDYSYWNEKAELDSIEYYKFLFPAEGYYQTAYLPQDTITQFAPFVLSDKGAIRPVHVIYVDHYPVYFSWSTILQPYSFHISPGYHKITLRTRDKSITLDKVFFEEKKKTILSINENTTGENIQIVKAKSKPTNNEKTNLYPYLFPYYNNFGKEPAYIQNEHTLTLLNSPAYNHYSRYSLAGPVKGNIQFYKINGYSLNFNHEAYYEYNISPALVKMKTKARDTYPKYFYSSFLQQPPLSDEVLTLKSIEKNWLATLEEMRQRTSSFPSPRNYRDQHGRLHIDIPKNTKDMLPVNHILVQYNNPEFMQIYPGEVRTILQLPENRYQLLTLFSHGLYSITDSIDILCGGINYIKINPQKHPADSFSIQINKLINSTYSNKSSTFNIQEPNKQNIRNSYQQYIYIEGNEKIVSGYVVDEMDDPLIGANITVPGTVFGTIADVEGHFSIRLPEYINEISISFIGYESQEIDLSDFEGYINMRPNVLRMEEVIVVGYGIARKSNLTAAISTGSAGYVSPTLEGKMAGILRGVSSVSKNDFVNYQDNSMILINGKVYTGDASSLANLDINNISIIKDDSMVGIYGSQAANGVIMITMNDDDIASLFNNNEDNTNFEIPEEFFHSNSVRTNFSDYAYWQPKLTTDANGKATFDVTFPDDITSWNTYVLGMSSKKQSGQTHGSIRSFKPFSAQLALPGFLIEGDTAYVIGKTLNYTQVPQEFTSSFKINNEVAYNKTDRITYSSIDTIPLTAQGDSVSIQYVTELLNNSYLDGEKREVAIYQPGMEETTGEFLALNNDTSFIKMFDGEHGKVHLYLENSELEVLNTEVDRLINYRYQCNEQLASRLQALLTEKIITEYEGKKWKKERQINKIINLLEKNRNRDGLWGWWKESATNYQFSYHIMKVLAQANKMGFKPKSTKIEEVAESLILKTHDEMKDSDKIELLRILKLFDLPLNYTYYIEVLEKNDSLPLNSRLKMTELKQLNDTSVNTDFLKQYEHQTILGNIYYRDTTNKEYFDIENTDVLNSLLAYRILRKSNPYENKAKLAKIRGYLFENKSVSGWRNTYETAQIIETVLPDILEEKISEQESLLTIQGDINISDFSLPLDTVFIAKEGINISKSGADLIYITYYQKRWNKNPQEHQEYFKIKTTFGNNEDKVTLEAGKITKLIVSVEVLREASHIMINIPIPAGCSYASKKQNQPYEIHREYFRNETAIFCEHLKKGTYTFEVELSPRFSGNYILNPARIELMYFPVFNANNEIKRIKIK